MLKTAIEIRHQLIVSTAQSSRRNRKGPSASPPLPPNADASPRHRLPAPFTPPYNIHPLPSLGQYSVVIHVWMSLSAGLPATSGNRRSVCSSIMMPSRIRGSRSTMPRDHEQRKTYRESSIEGEGRRERKEIFAPQSSQVAGEGGDGRCCRCMGAGPCRAGERNVRDRRCSDGGKEGRRCEWQARDTTQLVKPNDTAEMRWGSIA